MAELPRYVAFKSMAENLYLKYIKEDVEIHGYVKYDADAVVSPYTKFEVVPANVGEGYVHIRCCYNNKYWVCLPSSNTFVVAAANEPNEDRSMSTCTLFHPIYDSHHQAYRIKHVYLGYNTCSQRTHDAPNKCLCMQYSTPDADLFDLHIAVDMESSFALPRYLAFKGDNGCYLSAQWIQELPYLQFSSTDSGHPRNAYEVSTTNDGNARIKSNFFGKFWRLSPNWIWADSTDTTESNKDTLFKPILIDNDDDIVALKNLGNDNFCQRLSTGNKESCLNAAASSITNEARLEMYELIVSRSIYNLDFDIKNGWIHDEHVLTMANGSGSNDTSEENSIDVKLTYSVTETNTWSSTATLKISASTTLETGIPLITEGTIKISGELSEAYTWGETKTSTTQIETTYNVKVPPKSRVTVKLLATEGKCGIPYTYTQRDTLYNGDQVTENYDDGLYTGSNCYNFKYETQEFPL